MKKNIKRTIIFLFLLCMNNYSIAMDPPKSQYSLEQEEILPKMMNKLRTEGLQAAVLYVNDLSEKYALKKTYLTILNDEKRSNIVEEICLDYFRYDFDDFLNVAAIMKYIEKFKAALIESKPALILAFSYKEFYPILEAIKEFDQFKIKCAKRRGYEEVERSIKAEFYGIWCRNQAECVMPYFDFASVNKKYDKEIFALMKSVLKNIEFNLSHYCDEFFFHISVIKQAPDGEFFNDEVNGNSYVEKNIKEIPVLKNIIYDRRHINGQIIPLLSKSKFSLNDVVEMAKIIKLVVSFVETYQVDLINDYLEKIYRLKIYIENKQHYPSDELWTSEHENSLSDSSLEASSLEERRLSLAKENGMQGVLVESSHHITSNKSKKTKRHKVKYFHRFFLPSHK